MPLLTQNRAGENARERRQRAGRRARGVCTVCGAAKDDPARNLCATCRHHAREQTARYRQTGREAEVIRLRESLRVCISCGQREAAPGSVYCKSHRACRRYTWRKYSKKVGRTSQLSLREQPHA